MNPILSIGQVTTGGDWSQKVWGKTRRLATGRTFEVHQLEIKQGGQCSRHRHKKHNLFNVISGTLAIEFFDSNPQGKIQDKAAHVVVLDSTRESYHVPPFRWHRFTAITNCIVAETYWTDGGEKIDTNDIDRADEGQMLTVPQMIEGSSYSAAAWIAMAADAGVLPDLVIKGGHPC